MHERMKPLIAGTVVVGTLAFLTTGLRTRAQTGKSSATPRWVWLEREAVVVQPPLVIADGQVTKSSWSPDGRHVLALRVDAGSAKPDLLQEEPQPSDLSVTLWNASASRAFSLWKQKGILQHNISLDWIPGTQNALVSFIWEERNLKTDVNGTPESSLTPHEVTILVDTLREQATELSVPPGTDMEISPTQPLVLFRNLAENAVHVLDKNGVIGPALPLPKLEKTEKALGVDWMPDGAAAHLHWFEAIAGMPKGGKIRHARLDLTTGTVTPLDKAPMQTADTPGKPQPAGSAGPLRVRQTTQMLKEGAATHLTRPLWLESAVPSDQMRTLLCADGAQAQISPRRDGVLYVSQGVAWVSPLFHTPRDLYVKALRARAMLNAKQAGLALIMYSQDYDETLPASGSNLNDIIAPYVRDADMLDGLSYAYPGGPLAGIANPAQTILGTYAGPGGVAVIYADGHVKWKDN